MHQFSHAVSIIRTEHPHPVSSPSVDSWGVEKVNSLRPAWISWQMQPRVYLVLHLNNLNMGQWLYRCSYED